MKKSFLNMFVVLVTVLTACTTQDKIHPGDLMGMWITQTAEGKSLASNQMDVLQFLTLQRMVYGHAVELENGGSKWIEEPQYRFNVLYDKNLVNFWNSDPLKWNEQFVFKTQELTDNYWSGCFQGLYDYDYPMTFSRLAYTNYPNQILGLWEVINPNATNYRARFDYHSDGTYDFYQYNESDQTWVLKEANNGTYFLYGNYSVINYMSEQPQDVEAYACWFIQYIQEVDGKIQMKGEWTNEEGSTSSVLFEKVEI